LITAAVTLPPIDGPTTLLLLLGPEAQGRICALVQLGGLPWPFWRLHGAFSLIGFMRVSRRFFAWVGIRPLQRDCLLRPKSRVSSTSL